MKQARSIIEQAFGDHKPALAFSGGDDSMVLLDLVHGMGFRPPVIWADSQMEYPETLPFVQRTVARYGLQLHIAKAPITPPACWTRYGFPMLGKQSAREWMQTHRGEQSLGFKIDVSTCCRRMKIAPARLLTRSLDCDSQLTGQRGAQDDRLRALRAHKDGTSHYVKADKIHIINPLTGWTDSMVGRFIRQHNLERHPAKQRGMKTTGCMFCGGGCQFDNSGFRVLRHTDPQAWRQMIIEFGFGRLILAIKYDCHVDKIDAAVAELGGIDRLCQERPWLFDFTRETPLRGYTR